MTTLLSGQVGISEFIRHLLPKERELYYRRLVNIKILRSVPCRIVYTPIIQYHRHAKMLLSDQCESSAILTVFFVLYIYLIIELNGKERLQRVGYIILRFIVIVGCLYLFICSLSLLSDAFRLLGGKAAGEALDEEGIVANPIAGLMLGVLVTVLVQSSSTSTSIIVTMVGADSKLRISCHYFFTIQYKRLV